MTVRLDLLRFTAADLQKLLQNHQFTSVGLIE